MSRGRERLSWFNALIDILAHPDSIVAYILKTGFTLKREFDPKT